MFSVDHFARKWVNPKISISSQCDVESRCLIVLHDAEPKLSIKSREERKVGEF